MLNVSFFKRQKPRQFSYRPIYHDPEQEERDRRNNIRGAGTSETKNYVPGSIVKGMRMERVSSSSVKEEMSKNDNRNRIVIRLVAMLVMLFLIGYIVMNSTMLEMFFTAFLK